MTEIEQVQVNALKYWWVKRKEKAKKLGWKFEGNCYKHDDGTLIVIMLDSSNNKHFLQVSTNGNICFAPTKMTCF